MYSSENRSDLEKWKATHCVPWEEEEETASCPQGKRGEMEWHWFSFLKSTWWFLSVVLPVSRDTCIAGYLTGTLQGSESLIQPHVSAHSPCDSTFLLHGTTPQSKKKKHNCNPVEPNQDTFLSCYFFLFPLCSVDSIWRVLMQFWKGQM